MEKNKELSIQEMHEICKKHETCQDCELTLGTSCVLYGPNKYMFEVYKERKIFGIWEFVVLSTQFFKTKEAAKAYAEGCSFILNKNERFILMNRYTKEQEIITYDPRRF